MTELLKICVVLLVLAVKPCTAFKLTENVALKGTAHQSVDFSAKYSAARAIDGNRATNFANNSCTYITSKSDPWWRIALQKPYNIAMVSITNRGDCCASRIDGAEIRIGNSLENNGNNNQLIKKINSIRAGVTKQFRFQPVEGQYVNVRLPGANRILTVCEVEVYAIIEDVPEKVQPRLVNVAPVGQATQSSTNEDSAACLNLAQNAIDGNRQAELMKGSCTQTKAENDPWWRLDLIRSYAIGSVALTNRADGYTKQLNGAVVYIGDSLMSEGRANPICEKVSFIRAGGTEMLNCVRVLQGRYVTVALPGQNRTLSLCEVEVFGTPVEQKHSINQ